MLNKELVKQFARYISTIKQLQKSIRRKNKYISRIDRDNQRLTLELLHLNDGLVSAIKVIKGNPGSGAIMINKCKTADDVLAKYERAAKIEPLWEAVTLFSWNDMLLLKAEIEMLRNKTGKMIMDELNKETMMLNDMTLGQVIAVKQEVIDGQRKAIQELLEGLKPFAHKDLRSGCLDLPDHKILMRISCTRITLGNLRTAYDLVDMYEPLNNKTGE